MSERQRIDVWLYRARFTKTRSDAARLVTEGGVRLVREGMGRRLEKAAAEIAPGDGLLLPLSSGLRGVRVLALPKRREPPKEAAALYEPLEA
jgi:ribosomal 50S subunit-recycling heat shock protein